MSLGIDPSLLGLDFSEAKKIEAANAAKAADAALRAEKVASVLQVVAQAHAENAAGTPGEQLRDALLSGSNDAVKRLYELSAVSPQAYSLGSLAALQAKASTSPATTHFYIGDGK